MFERERSRMKRDPQTAILRPQAHFRPIFSVSHDRQATTKKLHAKLMTSTRFRL
jgi:hypothetical protein